jgi:hypothetical protein
VLLAQPAPQGPASRVEQESAQKGEAKTNFCKRLVSTEQSRAFYIDLWTTTLRLMNEVSFADAAAQAAPANAFGRTDSRDARIGEVVTAELIQRWSDRLAAVDTLTPTPSPRRWSQSPRTGRSSPRPGDVQDTGLTGGSQVQGGRPGCPFPD